jgi:amidohydrolase
MEYEEFVALRHELHRIAELSGREERTAAFLVQQLGGARPGRLLTGLGGHGVAAVFEGPEAGPTVLLRADMDGLPLPDRNDLPYASDTVGVSHKCGHDGHMAILLGVAHLLAESPITRGRVVLLFQPAEEVGAGARHVLEDPAFRDLAPDYALALHNLPGYPLGAVVVRQGTFAAASRGITVTLTGTSSHAAEPEAGRSPVPAAAALAESVMALPQLESALGAGAKATVVGIDVGGPAFGTSPGSGRVHITLRAYSPPVMDRLSRRCAELADGLATAYGLDVALTWTDDFPATVNDGETVALVERVARDEGLSIVHPDRPFGWSEDFGHFTTAFNGALVGLGAGEDQPALHHPDYDFPDDLLPVGMKLWSTVLRHVLEGPEGDKT